VLNTNSTYLVLNPSIEYPRGLSWIPSPSDLLGSLAEEGVDWGTHLKLVVPNLEFDLWCGHHLFLSRQFDLISTELLGQCVWLQVRVSTQHVQGLVAGDRCHLHRV
jgi:hypothetical protein